MKKLNNKGYMLVEIIMAFAITFALIYFLMDMVINLKNKNDDLLVDTVIKTDQTIISNKLMDYIIEDTSDEGNIEFKCENISVDGNSVKYGDDIIGIVDDSATISYDAKDNCSNVNGRIHINIPVEIKQMSDKNYDIVVDYRYKLMYCNPTKSYKCKDSSGDWKIVGSEPYTFTYTGACDVTGDKDNWKIKFLSDGTFTSECDMMVDIFLVGGGGGGGKKDEITDSRRSGGGGGGGGYTVTGSYKINSGNEYYIDIGSGGAAGQNGKETIAFNAIANGGYGAVKASGGSGGSGGGGGGYSGSESGGGGGSDGSNGSAQGGSAGSGQGTTTCEFGVENCINDLKYGGGGGGGSGYKTENFKLSSLSKNGEGGVGGGGSGSYKNAAKNGEDNTGGGGGGGGYGSGSGGKGGSGVVVIRNSRTAKENNMPNFKYDGYYLYSDDGNGVWKIKFLTSGHLTFYENVSVDTFLVGGGGGGGESTSVTDRRKHGGGGGGGGYTITGNANLLYGKPYEIVIGKGGMSENNGEDTTAFNLTANGGLGATNASGGSGGSGGGGGGYTTSYDGVAGGSDGVDGSDSSFGGGGMSQKRTTKEFGDEFGKLYSGGGGGGAGSKRDDSDWKVQVTASGNGGEGGGGKGGKRGSGGTAPYNTGGGGGGGGAGGKGGTGGSGIVVIRNTSNSSNYAVDFDYTGNYMYIDDGNGDWRIKFLTSGTLTINENASIDINTFLVGGGGGGGKSDNTGDDTDYGGGGGGGGYITTGDYTLVSGNSYEIFVGSGGESEQDGKDTTAFGLVAKGGLGSRNATGGKGGSGGGAGGEDNDIGAGNGGSNGGDGFSSGYASGGVGNDAFTCEFGLEICDDKLLYAGGGGGGSGSDTDRDGNWFVATSARGLGGTGGGGKGGKNGIGGKGIPNTGGGGGGGSNGGSGGTGGSGIVVIRNKR